MGRKKIRVDSDEEEYQKSDPDVTLGTPRRRRSTRTSEKLPMYDEESETESDKSEWEAGMPEDDNKQHKLQDSPMTKSTNEFLARVQHGMTRETAGNVGVFRPLEPDCNLDKSLTTGEMNADLIKFYEQPKTDDRIDPNSEDYQTTLRYANSGQASGSKPLPLQQTHLFNMTLPPYPVLRGPIVQETSHMRSLPHPATGKDPLKRTLSGDFDQQPASKRQRSNAEVEAAYILLDLSRHPK